MQFFKDIYNLFFPELCLACATVLTNNENIVCTSCRFELPETHFTKQKNNTIEKIFVTRLDVVEATALLYYKKGGLVQNLIHNLKYNGHQEIGVFFGEWLGNEILSSNRFKSLDYIIPVPLYKKRLQERGFNQVTLFGKKLSNILDVPYKDSVLIRETESVKQSKKSRLERWQNVNHIFKLTEKNSFKNKHILLIDDILTSGATIESCYNCLKQIENIKISIATMSYTK